MINKRWVALAALVALVAACSKPSKPTDTETVPPKLPVPPTVAVLVLDQFTTRPDPSITPEDNCAYTGIQANEVGSGGGGDGLPDGVTHGEAVFDVIDKSLEGTIKRDDQPPVIDDSGVIKEMIVSRTYGGRRVLLVGVDTAYYSTNTITTNLRRIRNTLVTQHGASGFVLNMSFFVVPCDLKSWLEGQKDGYISDDSTIFEAYKKIIEGVPELRKFKIALENATPRTADGLLTHPDLAKTRDAFLSNLFYAPLSNVSNALDLNRPQTKPGAVYQRLSGDPLRLFLDEKHDSVIPVAAAGNGVVLPDTGERKQLDFPFAPALWPMVASVSAAESATRTTNRARYSNGGEVMMDGSYNGAFGTSFAAPRLAALEALYLINGGGAACDGENPPLGYSRSETGPPEDLHQHWRNLWLGATPAPDDAALEFCSSFYGLSRVPALPTPTST